MKHLLLAVVSCFVLSLCVDEANAGPFRRNRVTYSQSTTTTTQTSSVSTGGVTLSSSTTTVIEGENLEAVNRQRAARGLRPFLPCPLLTEAAKACAAHRASVGLFGHTSNDFQFVPAGGQCSAAGCAAYPGEYGFLACCVYDNYTYAGAYSVRGRDGKLYHHIFVR